MVEPLRHEDVRQQPGADRAARDRLRRQRSLHRLDVVPLLFAAPAQVRRPLQDADEQTGRAIVQTLGYVGADAHPHVAAARAGLLRLRENQHFLLARQVGARRPPAVAPALPGHVGTGNVGRRRGHGFFGRSTEVEQRRALDALRAPAERQADQVLDVGLLLVDRRPQLGDRCNQLGDHVFEDTGIVRQVRRIECKSHHVRAHALVDAPGSPGVPKSASGFEKKCSA
jgi:hypothetical protein